MDAETEVAGYGVANELFWAERTGTGTVDVLSSHTVLGCGSGGHTTEAETSVLVVQTDAIGCGEVVLCVRAVEDGTVIVFVRRVGDETIVRVSEEAWATTGTIHQ